MREKWKCYDDMESNLKETEMYRWISRHQQFLFFFSTAEDFSKVARISRIYFLLRVFNPSKFSNLVVAVSPRCSVSTIGGKLGT